MPSEKLTLSLLYEAMSLKRRPRMGWLESGAPFESVAEHSFGTAAIALSLARMEKLAPEEEAALLRMALLHDLHEARVGDLSRLQRNYVAANYARAEREMLKGTHLEGEIGLLQGKLHPRLSELAKDADRLDLLFRAIENSNAGNRNMRGFIRFVLPQVKSGAGKKLARMAMKGMEK